MWEKDGKLLGVIGGMGPEATKLFYEKIIKNTDAQIDQDHLNMIIFNHASMPDRTEAILSGNTETAKHYLIEDAKHLEKLGCAAIAIPCNTSHYFAKDIQDAISIPFVNMIEETAKLAKKYASASGGKLGILATDGTIRTQLYQKALDAEAVEWEIPSEETQRCVMSVIYDYVKAGKKASYEVLKPAVDELQAKGCKSFVLGCTELSVLQEYCKLPTDTFIDAMTAAARKCIELCGHRLAPEEIINSK